MAQGGGGLKTSPPGKQEDAGGKMIQVLCLFYLSIDLDTFINKSIFEMVKMGGGE